MTVIDYVKEQVAIKVSKENQTTFIKNLIEEGIIDDKRIAKLAGVTVDFVNKVKKSIKLGT